MEKNYENLLRINQNAQILEKYLQEVEQQSADLELIHDAVQDFSEVKEQKEILVPIVNGIFFKAKITDKSKFLVNIGAEGTVVEMSLKDAKDLILKQITATRENQIELTNELNNLIEQINKLDN